jgi:uroporphyrinogen decarboxylase
MTPRMTPRERVQAALAHQAPDRVPFSWGFGPTAEMGLLLQTFLAARGIDWPRLEQAVDDVLWLGPDGIPGPPGPPRTDGWGIRRKPVSYGAGAYDEIEYHPLAGLDTVAQIEAHPWPNPENTNYGTFRAKVAAADPRGVYARKFAGGNPFEIYCWMTGLEEALVNLIARPDLVEAAMDRITSYFTGYIEGSLRAAGDLIDLVFLADDLGSQEGLLVSRETYRQLIQPFHRRLTDAVRAHAPHATIMFHSDGAVFDVLPDLIDAGIDMLEAVQTDAKGMEPRRLKAAFGARLGFHGGISVQQLLPHGTVAEVEAGCADLVRVFGAGGGYIAAPAQAIQVGTPPDNVLAMLRTVLGEADYAAALRQAAR